MEILFSLGTPCPSGGHFEVVATVNGKKYLCASALGDLVEPVTDAEIQQAVVILARDLISALKTIDFTNISLTLAGKTVTIDDKLLVTKVEAV